MHPPDKLNDGSRAASWFNKLREFAACCWPLDGVGYRVIRSGRGWSLEIPQASGGGSSTKQYKVITIQGDFLTCRKWDGATLGTQDIYVARSPELRRSYFEKVGGVAYSSDGDAFTATFVYSSNTKRVKTISGVAETQVVIPYYQTDIPIVASSQSNATGVTDPDGNMIYLVEMTQRAWAAP